MKVLLIIAAVLGGLLLLLLLLLLFGKAKIRITCEKKPRVVASILGIRFTIVSDKEAKGADQDLSRCRNPRRALKKELKRQRKEAKKALKKKRRKAAHRAEKRQQKKAKAASNAPTPNLKENIEMITALLKKLHAVTQDKIKIRIKRFHIRVGTDDAAKTAILYGTVVQCVAYLSHWIEANFTRLRRKPGEMQVIPDYTSGKSSAEIDIICSIRLSSALGIGLKMLSSYKGEKKLALKKARLRMKQKRAA